LFYAGIESLGGVFSGRPPLGAFYAFLKFDPEWKKRVNATAAHLIAQGFSPVQQGLGPGASSPSWDLTAFLIAAGRIGCVPGVDFGPGGEGYLRFCFARDRAELAGAIESMRRVFYK
jgi:aspartate/methionine/tyrosine aminotransferase